MHSSFRRLSSASLRRVRSRVINTNSLAGSANGSLVQWNASLSLQHAPTRYFSSGHGDHSGNPSIGTSKSPIPPSSASQPGESLIVEVTLQNFTEVVVKSPIAVMLNIWAPWSQPCVQLKTKLEAVVKAAGGALRLANINADEQPELIAQLRATAVPTIVGILHGRAIDSLSGTVTDDRVRQLIQNLVGAAEAAGAIPDAAVMAATAPPASRDVLTEAVRTLGHCYQEVEKGGFQITLQAMPQIITVLRNTEKTYFEEAKREEEYLKQVEAQKEAKQKGKSTSTENVRPDAVFRPPPSKQEISKDPVPINLRDLTARSIAVFIRALVHATSTLPPPDPIAASNAMPEFSVDGDLDSFIATSPLDNSKAVLSLASTLGTLLTKEYSSSVKSKTPTGNQPPPPAPAGQGAQAGQILGATPGVNPNVPTVGGEVQRGVTAAELARTILSSLTNPTSPADNTSKMSGNSDAIDAQSFSTQIANASILLTKGNHKEAVDIALDLLKKGVALSKDASKKTEAETLVQKAKDFLFQTFDTLGPKNPITVQGRRDLGKILFR